MSDSLSHLGGPVSKRILICCGAGGVGKTTSSAALALQLALHGHRVAVITIDPARRLADALGLPMLGHEPCAVDLKAIDPSCEGHLDAMMLDMKQTFDSIIVRHSPDEESCRKLLESRYYRFVSEKLAGSHEYMAMERLYQLHTECDYDILVVDTPPAQNAMDFLKAPKRLAGVMSEGVVRWMSLPKDRVGFRLLERGSKTVMTVLKKLAGEQTVGEIAEFFSLISGLADGFRERSLEMMRLLESDHTSFVLVSAASPAARFDALRFLDLLRENGLPFGGAIVNRVNNAPGFERGKLPVDLPSRPSDVTKAQWADLLDGLQRVGERQYRFAEGDAPYTLPLSGDSALWAIPHLHIDLNDPMSLAAVASHLNDAARTLSPV